jgi:prolyl-tRNA synthetase
LSIILVNASDSSIDPILSAFFQNLEETLTSQANSFYINGNATPTIADIFIAIVYHHIQTSIVVPSKCDSMVQSILHHPKVKSHLPQLEKVTVDSANTEFQENAVIQQLLQWKLEYSVYSHPTCVTAEELVQTVPLPDPNTHTHTKNLVLQDKKHGTYLLTLHPDTKVQTKELGGLLQLSGKTNFRMASSDLLEEHLQCRPGTVGPLAIAMDTKRQIPTILVDQKLLTYAYIHSHPLRNDASVILTSNVLLEYLNRTEHEIKTMDFSSPVALTGTKESKSSSSSNTTGKVNKDKKSVEKGKTLLAVGFKKEENFSMWYSDVITLAEMISYYDISGCYILRPWSYQMWEFIQNWFNHEVSHQSINGVFHHFPHPH